MSRLLAVVATLTVAAALLAGSVAPDSADAQEKRRTAQKGLTALLLPFQSDGSARGMLQARVTRGGSVNIIAILIGHAVDPGQGGEPQALSLNFTKVSCGALRRDPSRVSGGTIPVYSSSDGGWDIDNDGYAYVEGDNVYKARQLRGVKSVALVVRGQDGNDEIQACGNTQGIVLKDVLVSS